MGNQLIDQKINPELLADETPTVHGHINQMAFARLLIPRIISEKRVLYMDSDAIIDDNLDELFSLDMGKYPLAAVHDVFYFSFNSGVLIFNNEVLNKQPDIVDKMLALGQQKELLDGDQDILNHFFADNFIDLGLEYNYSIGYDRDVTLVPENSPQYFNMMADCHHPKIIHYASGDKPWNLVSSGRLREKWWSYYFLDWSEIVMHSETIQRPKFKRTLFTFTNTDQFKDIDKIVQQLSDYQFVIAAWTTMSPTLLSAYIQ